MTSPLRFLAGIAAPARCAACGGHSGGGPLCDECTGELGRERALASAPGPPGVDLAVAAASFEGIGRRMAIGLKYGKRLGLAAVAAEAIARAAEAHLAAGPVALVPVPPDPLRGRWRGFDPADELAIALADRLDLPLNRCLRRRPGRRQVGRARGERLASPPVVRPRRPPPRTALLVDDVWTTGATLSACARALRAGGCERVVALALARAERAPRLPPRRAGRTI